MRYASQQTISLYKAIQPVQYSDFLLEQKIKWPKIQLVHSSVIALPLQEKVSLVGPISITSYQELLPQSQLSFIYETKKYSTGESLRNRLMEILERVDVDVLLLDEWDANLDREKMCD